MLFNDTFTNYYEPENGLAALDVLAAGVRAGLAPNAVRPAADLDGLLADARELARHSRGAPDAAAAGRFYSASRVACPPCERCPGAARRRRAKAVAVARASRLFEEHVATIADRLPLRGPASILFHGHCHQKSMGLVEPARALLAHRRHGQRARRRLLRHGRVVRHTRRHYDVSKQIGERRLLPAVRQKTPGTVVVASGTSCRHQILDFTGERALHPAVLLRNLLKTDR